MDTTITGLSNTVTPLKAGDATITVTGDGGKATSFLVKVKSVQSFTVVGYKEYYDPNDDFVYEDDVAQVHTRLNVVYTDGTVSKDPIPVKEGMVKLPVGWNVLSTPPTAVNQVPERAASEPHELIIQYGGVEEKFKVTIRGMRWVTIVGTLKRTVYNRGEAFDPEGLTLTASYDIGPDVGGIPLTQEILSTSVTAAGNGNKINDWNDAAAIATGLRGAGLGPFVYKGQTTTAAAINQGALNGEAWIPNLTVSDYVVQIGNEYMTAGDTGASQSANLAAAFRLAEKKNATIRVSYTSPIKVNTAVASIKIPASTHIILEGCGGGVTLEQSNKVNNVNPPLFSFIGDASLEVKNFILLTPYDTNNGTDTAMVELTDARSKFTLGAGSVMQISRAGVKSAGGSVIANPIAGAINIQAGEAIIEKTAIINIDPAVASTSGSYMATAGIFVGRDGKLTMNGGVIRGTPVTNATGGAPRVGIGDVVVVGALELKGEAWIQRLALATGDSPVTGPLVTVNTGWNPIHTVILNLAGNSPSATDVQRFFINQQLFIGPGVGTVPANVVFETQTFATRTDGGGFFMSGDLVVRASGPNALAGTGNPQRIFPATALGATPGQGEYSITADGKFILN